MHVGTSGPGRRRRCRMQQARRLNLIEVRAVRRLVLALRRGLARLRLLRLEWRQTGRFVWTRRTVRHPPKLIIVPLFVSFFHRACSLAYNENGGDRGCATSTSSRPPRRLQQLSRKTNLRTPWFSQISVRRFGPKEARRSQIRAHRMASYRIYCLDRAGKIRSGEWFEAANEDEALAISGHGSCRSYPKVGTKPGSSGGSLPRLQRSPPHRLFQHRCGRPRF